MLDSFFFKKKVVPDTHTPALNKLTGNKGVLLYGACDMYINMQYKMHKKGIKWEWVRPVYSSKFRVCCPSPVRWKDRR